MNPQFYKDSDGLFRCPEFDRWRWLRHGFGTRDSVPYYAAHTVTTLRQIHSNLVFDAHDLEDRSREGDALITHQPGKRIGVRTADCVPIIMVDPVTRSAAAIHAGWRGTVARIAARAVDALAWKFSADAANLSIALGPSIRVCCYEVGADVAAQFRSILPESTESDGPRNIDLIEANRRVIIDAGVPAKHIYDSGLCTFCMPQEFFSYRRDPNDPGRLLSFVEITTES